MGVNPTTSFLPDIGEIVEEAYERAGLEMQSGYDLRTARRSLDLMMLEWQNRGINLWTVEQVDLGLLIAGTAAYPLASGTIAVLEVLLRENEGVTATQVDYEMGRISRDTYAGIPNKLTQAKPVQVYVDRQQGEVKINLWPTPDSSTKYKIIYYRIRRMTDTGPGGTYDADVPDRFWPALIAGLAYNIALKRPEASERVQLLKQAYEEQFAFAADEDREKAPIRFYPGGYTYT